MPSIPEPLLNWAGNYAYGAARVHRPATLGELCALVSRCENVKALGTRHSFNDIADTPGDLVSTEKFDQIVALDTDARTVTVEAGIRYGTLCEYLIGQGWALHNLASLPHISVGGACATATHGSGDNNGNLSTAVVALELVTANGNVHTFSREQDGDVFPGVVVGIGALGIVTKLALRIEPAYTLRQVVYENLPFDQVQERFDTITSSAYSVSLFTDWRGPRINQVWRKSREGDGADLTEPVWLGAMRAPHDLHPLPEGPAEFCTPQMGVPGPWYERLPHFRMEFTPSSGEELQSEYFVPRRYAPAAIAAIQAMGYRIAPHLHISEIRTIAADDLWLSPCFGEAQVGIHFTWKKEWEAVRGLLPVIEESLKPFEARPHWAKLSTVPAARLAELYPKLPDFHALIRKYDPSNTFGNLFLERTVAERD